MKNLDGQLNINFESAEVLEEILKSIYDKYPEIKEIIKDRISYDGNHFWINTVKMTEEELMKKMEELNKYETDKKLETVEKKIRLSELLASLDKEFPNAKINHSLISEGDSGLFIVGSENKKMNLDQLRSYYSLINDSNTPSDDDKDRWWDR